MKLLKNMLILGLALLNGAINQTSCATPAEAKILAAKAKIPTPAQVSTNAATAAAAATAATALTNATATTPAQIATALTNAQALVAQANNDIKDIAATKGLNSTSATANQELASARAAVTTLTLAQVNTNVATAAAAATNAASTTPDKIASNLAIANGLVNQAKIDIAAVAALNFTSDAAKQAAIKAAQAESTFAQAAVTTLTQKQTVAPAPTPAPAQVTTTSIAQAATTQLPTTPIAQATPTASLPTPSTTQAATTSQLPAAKATTTSLTPAMTIPATSAPMAQLPALPAFQMPAPPASVPMAQLPALPTPPPAAAPEAQAPVPPTATPAPSPLNLSEFGLAKNSDGTSWDESGYEAANPDYSTLSSYGTLKVNAGKNFWDQIGYKDVKHIRTIRFNSPSVSRSYQCDKKEFTVKEFTALSTVDLSIWTFDPEGYNKDKNDLDLKKIVPVKHFKESGLSEGRTISIIDPAGKHYQCTALK